jgi:hypothetical protein
VLRKSCKAWRNERGASGMKRGILGRERKITQKN